MFGLLYWLSAPHALHKAIVDLVHVTKHLRLNNNIYKEA